jgi:ParB family transcriptional regulator, chromosome partitioning protein
MNDKRRVGDDVLAEMDALMKSTGMGHVAPVARTYSTPTKLGREMLEGAGPTIARQKEAIEKLEAERSDGMVVLRLDPKSISYTQFANRHQRALNAEDAAFSQLKASIRTHGQDTPIRVRPGAAGASKDYELIEGHRRHAAILQLDKETDGGFPILARLDAKAAESKNLVLKMYRENAEREDLSAYETGMMFMQWISVGLFATQRAVGEAIGQTEQNVGRYVAVANLPDYVLQAFRDPRSIALRWGSKLAKASGSPSDEIKRKAAELARQEPAPTPEAVFAALTGVQLNAPAKDRTSGGSKRDAESVKEGNKVLFELSSREGQFGIRLGKHIDKRLRRPLQRELKEWLHSWLKEHS